MLCPWTSITIFQLKFEMMNDWFLLFSYITMSWLIIYWELSSLKLKELTNLDAFLQEPSFFPFFSYDRVLSQVLAPQTLESFSLGLVFRLVFSFSDYCWTRLNSVEAILRAWPPFLGPAILLLMGLNIELFTVSCHLFAPLPYFSCDFFHIHSLVYLLWSSENRPIKVKWGHDVWFHVMIQAVWNIFEK